MNMIELDAILAVIDRLERQEMEYAANYIKHNPDDAENRNRQRDLIMDGMHRVYRELLKEFT